MSQMEMVDRDSLVPSPHPDRRSQAYLPDTTEALAVVSQLKGAAGYRVERLFRCLLLQVMEDLSDRDLARYLEENLAAKSFCGFPLSEPTPAYCLFTRVRTRIGPTRLSPLVATMREQLKAAQRGCHLAAIQRNNMTPRRTGIATGGIRISDLRTNGVFLNGRSACAPAGWQRINSQPSCRLWRLTSNGCWCWNLRW